MRGLFAAIIMLGLLGAGCSQEDNNKKDAKGGSQTEPTDQGEKNDGPPIKSDSGKSGQGEDSDPDKDHGDGKDKNDDHSDQDESKDVKDSPDMDGDVADRKNNEFLKLQSRICEPAKDECEAYDLGAKASENGFCPYAKDCADESCSVRRILSHFCNCIYQLELGNTFFNGKDHDCIAEFKAAEDE